MHLTPLMGILSLSILTGGLQPLQDAAPLPFDKRHGWTEDREVQGGAAQKKSLQKKFILRSELKPDSSPERDHATLYERDRSSGELIRVAERVEGARKAPDGTLFFVQKQRLYKYRDGVNVPLVDKSSGDFDFADKSAKIALVRLNEMDDPGTLALVDSEGKVERTLADAGHGALWLPVFTPDGKSIVYVSGETGFGSFFRVDLDGTNKRQLTNQNIRQETGGVFSQDFVPPAESRERMRFVTDTRLEYESGQETWQLDIETGETWRVRVAVPEKGVTP